MNIEIITTSAVENNLDTTRNFGLILNQILSALRMMHWYIADPNAHEILGDLYDDLSDLFDKLQEEIIGTAKRSGAIFPMYPQSVDFDFQNLTNYQQNENIMQAYKCIEELLKSILLSLEFSNYINNVQSGLNNTRDEIISRINKSCYLLSMFIM